MLKGTLRILRPSRQMNVLILNRVVMPVGDRKARSRTIAVYFAFDPAPPAASDTPVLPSGAEAVDVLRSRHSSTSRTVSGFVVPDYFCCDGNAFCRSGETFLFTASVCLLIVARHSSTLTYSVRRGAHR